MTLPIGYNPDPLDDPDKPRGHGGRIAKFTNETLKVLEEQFRNIASIADACSAAGISEASFHAWMKQGKTGGKAEYRAFRARIEAARREFRGRLKARLRTLADTTTDPDKIVRILDRIDPEFAAARAKEGEANITGEVTVILRRGPDAKLVPEAKKK